MLRKKVKKEYRFRISEKDRLELINLLRDFLSRMAKSHDTTLMRRKKRIETAWYLYKRLINPKAFKKEKIYYWSLKDLRAEIQEILKEKVVKVGK